MKWEEIESEVIALRRELHQHPELSSKEIKTAERIVKYALQYSPSEVIKNIGGNGLAIIFDGDVKGETVLIRCELDALPIDEENDFEYKSISENVAHKCGHDGHMAIVSGLIPLLSASKIRKGRVVLLYQPAEETGQGAAQILDDEKFLFIKPDYLFALHNLPGYKKNEIVIKENEFASASKGLIVRLKGKTSHAAEPEKGISPSFAVAELIQKLTDLPKTAELKDFSLVTIIHTKIGERAFGTTPGYAEVMATLRSYKNRDMELLTNAAEELVQSIALNYKLKYEIEWVEEFPATENNKECVDLIRNCAEENKLVINEIENPFRWSEDFGHFTRRFEGVLFGLGSGLNQPQLHNPDYDFPDDILQTGTKMFYSIIQKILG